MLTTVFTPGSTLSTILDPLPANAPYLQGSSLFEKTLRSQYNAMGVSPATVDSAFGTPNFWATPLSAAPVASSGFVTSPPYSMDLISQAAWLSLSDSTASSPVADSSSASATASTSNQTTAPAAEVSVSSVTDAATEFIQSTASEVQSASNEGPGTRGNGLKLGHHKHGNGGPPGLARRGNN